MRYPRFDSRANDAMIEEISRRRCGFGQRWDPVNKVCRSYGHHLGELDRKPKTDMPPPPPQMPPMEGPPPQNMGNA
jgi:hypothetical protein|tara:strand:+ start:206 stop:433 length:228 start_codon:yes stop_codon:yes gene_type:complete